MPFPPEVESARAQVFQQVGRNVLRFQRLELIMKSMVASSRISTTGGESPKAHERRTEAIHKKTLGLISGQFFDEVISNQPPCDGPPAFFEDPTIPKNRVHIASAFVVHFQPEEHARWKVRVKSLIEERNALVHTSLLHIELETFSGCQKALAALEEQGARVSAEIDHLKPIVKSLEESKASLREHLADDAFWKHLFPSKA